MYQRKAVNADKKMRFSENAMSIVLDGQITRKYELELPILIDCLYQEIKERNATLLDNPFLKTGSLRMKYKTVDLRLEEINKPTEGETVITSMSSTMKVWSESTPHVGFAVKYAKKITGLSSQGINVLFGYIIPCMTPGTISMVLKPNHISEHIGNISISSVKLGIKSLVENDIIAQVEKNKSDYWLNINLFFRGYVMNGIIGYLKDKGLYNAEALQKALAKALTMQQ